MRPIATTRSATGIPTGRLAVWWVIASEIVIFGGLLASLHHASPRPPRVRRLRGAHQHGVRRAQHVRAADLELVRRCSRTRPPRSATARPRSSTCGARSAAALTFLCIKSFEWTHEISEGFTITRNAFWSFYYTAAGIHACHVIGGIIIMAIISFDVRKNKELQRVELIGNYWHFVDIVWIFLFPLLYIAK